MNDMNWIAVYPEIVVLTMACVIALVDLFVKDPRRTVTYLLTLATLVVAGGMELAYFSGSYLEGATVYAMQGMAVNDPMGNLLEFFAVLSTLVTLVYSRGYAGERDMLRGGELFTLSLFSLLGIIGDDLGQQLPRDLPRPGADDAVALRAGGAAPRPHPVDRGRDEVLRAGRAGQRLPALRPVDDVRRHRLARHSTRCSVPSAPARSTSRCSCSASSSWSPGLGFKLGAAPFHMWVPDVYHGAPTAVTLADRRRAQAGRLRDHHPPAGRGHAGPGAPTGSRC